MPRARQTPPGTPDPPVGSVHPGAPQLVRIDDIERGGHLHAELVLDYANLVGLDVQTGSVGSSGLSVAANGDVFFGVQDTLFVLHRDGSRQRILDGRDVIDDNLFPVRGGVAFGIAASAPDRVWLWADPSEGDRPQRLFEAIDPNADGDWSDRVLRPVALPDSLPFAKRWQRTSWNSFPDWKWQLAAEPSLPGDNRTHSVLASYTGAAGCNSVYLRRRTMPPPFPRAVTAV